MAFCHTLLLKSTESGIADIDLLAQVRQLADASPMVVRRTLVCRALHVPEIYAYFELVEPQSVSAAARDRCAAAAHALPAFAAPTVDRLQRMFEPAAASAGQPAPFHYVVEMDPAEGWRDELMRWYDTEHMPGLAGVTGCVRAQRYVNGDRGPYSLACYDLASPETTATPAWLAVRATAWSDLVRPQFRNPKRTMFRTLG